MYAQPYATPFIVSLGVVVPSALALGRPVGFGLWALIVLPVTASTIGWLVWLFVTASTIGWLPRRYVAQYTCFRALVALVANMLNDTHSSMAYATGQKAFCPVAQHLSSSSSLPLRLRLPPPTTSLRRWRR